MARIVGEGGQGGNRYNQRFDNTEPGLNPGRARRCIRGRSLQNVTAKGKQTRREGAAKRTIREPEDVSKPSLKPVDRASRQRLDNVTARPFLLFGESDAFV
jgi:hypothetical protein